MTDTDTGEADAMTEAQWEDAVALLGKRAVIAWYYLVCCISRAQNTATAAEAAGVIGAHRLLTRLVANFDPNSAEFREAMEEPTLRGIVTVAEANRVLDWQGEI